MPKLKMPKPPKMPKLKAGTAQIATPKGKKKGKGMKGIKLGF
jgi:hypothetical protein